jgi:FkbM family methyltransferase
MKLLYRLLRRRWIPAPAAPAAAPPEPAADGPAPPPAPSRIWLDVGAHLGEKTFAAAQADPGLRVYAFEPNWALVARRLGALPNWILLPVAVTEQDGCADFYLNRFPAASSLLPFDPTGLRHWRGGDQLQVERRLTVPTLRLDTFLDLMGIAAVDYLKIDAQGNDLQVVRSLGRRLRDVRELNLEVQVTDLPLYAGAARKDDVLDCLKAHGFDLLGCEPQSFGQEENLTFRRAAG